MLNNLDTKKYKIKLKARDLIEPEEIFIDAEEMIGMDGEKSGREILGIRYKAKEREVLNDLEKNKMETPVSSRVILFIFFLIGTALFTLFLSLFHLQIMRREFYSARAERNKTRAVSLVALRGVIYDRGNQQLVSNGAIFDLMVVPKALPANDALLNKKIQKLALVLKVDENELLESILKIRGNGGLTPIILRSGIDLDSVIAIEGDPEGFPGIEIEKKPIRSYFFGDSLAHLLGYVGRADFAGKDGLELFYEDELKGEPGKIRFEVDARHNIRQEVSQKAQSGKNLILSIDKDLTLASIEAFKNNIHPLGLNKGAVVIENPKTGEILAMVSLPNFDANQFSKNLTQEEYNRIFNDPSEPMFNRAVSGAYPIGSIIKPLIAVAALEEKIITPDRQIRAPLQIEIPNPYFPQKLSIFKDWRDHGWVAMREAIAWSSNVYFYAIGGGYKEIKGLGIERIKKYAELFGLGAKSGIDLPSEVSGFFPDPSWKKKVNKNDPIWRLGDTYNVSIGQGEVLATPLQVANYISAIVNGGFLLKPRIVKAIVNEDNFVIEEKKTEILRSGLASEENLKIVKEGMRQTVTSGSAQILNYLPLEVAGKTGTAQYHNNTRSHAWFVGFAPYNDPEIVVTVLVEGGGEGGRIAVPVAQEIFNWYYWNRIIKKL